MRDRRQFEDDVFWEAYRRGLDPHQAVHDSDNCFWHGAEPVECVNKMEEEIHARERARREEEIREEEWRQRQEEEAREFAALEEANRQAEYEAWLAEQERAAKEDGHANE